MGQSAMLNVLAVRVGVRLLGGFEVDIDGCLVPESNWRRRSAASLVKLLALSDRRKLHREQVIDAMWPDVTIDEAAPRLHKAAHFVRKATGVRDSVTMEGQFVVLFPDDEVIVDAIEFERRATDALATGELAALDAALHSYGGDLLPDDLYEEWTFSRRQHLQVRHRDLLRQAERWTELTVLDPTDEEAHVEVMRALVEGGDRSGARRQFEMLKRALQEELAVEPGAEAVAWYQRALEAPAADRDRRQATEIDVGPPGGLPLPPALELLADQASFVGRVTELETLREVWQLARGGRTLVAFITGEPGIGKSRLVSELAVTVHEDGGRVLLGACFEDADEPYGPFAQAVVDDASDLGAAQLDRRAGGNGDAIARLAPRLAARLPTSDASPSSDDLDVSERADVLDAIAHWFTTSAMSAPLLLVVEDIHWSTSTTRDALRHLVRRAGRAPLLIVATLRDSRPDLDADLATLLADLVRSPSVRRVALHGLDRDEVAELAGPGAADAALILAETRGNPLLVTHVGTDPSGGTLPIWLYRRDQLLDDEARAVLDQAAMFGTEFDADLLAGALGVPLLRVLESLEAAEGAGLVIPRPGRRAGFAFVHALFRSARYRALPLRRRLELHANAARAIATRADDESLLGEWARHSCLAVPLVDARDAVDLARRAAQHYEHAYGYDEAVAHYRRGLDAARLLDPPAPGAILDLEVRIGAALHHRGDPTGLPMLLDAARRARAIGDLSALVRAAVAIPQFGAVGFVDPMPEGRAVTEAALDALGDTPSPERARLLMDLASHWLFVNVAEALELARRAEAVARDLDDPELLGAVLLAARHLFSHPGRIDDRVRIGTELELLGRRLDRLAFKLAGAGTLAAAHLERGELAAWRQRFDRFVELLAERSLAFFRLQAMGYEANQAFLAGDLARAEELAELTVPWSRGIGAGRVYAESMIVTNRRLQARDTELVARFERAAARSKDAWYRCSLAAVQARSGRIAEARSTMEELRDEGFPIREIYPWSVAVTDLAEAAEVAEAPEVAAHVLTVAQPYSGRLAVSGPCPNRPFDQALAQAALSVGDAAAAAAYASRAVAASRRRQTPVFLMRELVFLAEARRRDGDPAAAIRPLVREALTLAEHLEAPAVSVDVERYGLPS
jgi:DNA-binding SARP family transcriptional activator